mgnify:CR=1 FL=1
MPSGRGVVTDRAVSHQQDKASGSKKAARTGAEGLSALPAWEAMAVPSPRLVLVSHELQGRMCGSGGGSNSKKRVAART